MTTSGAARDDILLTSDPASRNLALDEIIDVFPGSRLQRWLSEDVGWVTLDADWASLALRFSEAPPVFCRHICPVRVKVPLKQTPSDLDALASACESFRDDLDPSQPFSVQTRILDHGWPYGPFDANNRMADVLARGGARLDVRYPVSVLSAVLTTECGYIGLSLAADNLSDWAGGARRFRRDKDQISRAEFKLLEAMEIFDLDPSRARLALDLGAAPGGWTRVLRQHGARVIAVDPADLAPVLARDSGVQHFRQLAQDFLPGARDPFDIVLNDMRMDARDSARLMDLAAGRLKRSGWAVMTLKLPRRGTKQVMGAALVLLRRAFEVTGVRQLFHNRSEVTVALRRTR